MLDVPDVAEGAYFHGREVFLVFFNVHTTASFSLRLYLEKKKTLINQLRYNVLFHIFIFKQNAN